MCQGTIALPLLARRAQMHANRGAPGAAFGALPFGAFPLGRLSCARASESPVKWVALVAWLATAGVGVAMAALWLERGGTRQGGLPHSVHVRRLATHFVLAVSGLVVWIVYLGTGTRGVA